MRFSRFFIFYFSSMPRYEIHNQMFEIRRYYNYARVVLYDSFEKTINYFQRFRFTVKGGMFERSGSGVES